MSDLFTAVFNMSVTATYIALGVMVIRLLLTKLPKIFSYVLWSAVLIRLVVPFSYSSSFSFLSFFKSSEQSNSAVLTYIPYDIDLMKSPTIDLGVRSISQSVSNLLPAAQPYVSANPMQIIMSMISSIWIAGIFVLIVYSVWSYLQLMKKVSKATLIRDHIYESDRINQPFVCGFIKPRIYVPLHVPEEQLAYILAHEQTHISRRDYLVKPFAFLVVIVHWFNPVMWVSFALMSKDMEMSCDESVIKKLGVDRKGGYSSSLLSLAVKRSGLLVGSPLGFGESHIKARIKNIVTYRKPAFWVIALAIVIVAVMIVIFTANPLNDQNDDNKLASSTEQYNEYNVDALIDYKTPYVGNNSKVVSLIDIVSESLPIKRQTVELHTANPPYGITINYVDMDEVTGAENALGTMKAEGDIGDALFVRSILLFSLIDNVDYITSNITDGYDGALHTFTYTREMAEQWVGGDVRDYADSSTTLMELIDQLDGLVYVNEGIEQGLAVIMSSPMTSSNPYDYIQAHPDEYERIIKTGEEALHYLLAQFEKPSFTNDLRAHIMMALLQDLLGDRNNVSVEGLLPQEWYAQLKIIEATRVPDFKVNVSDPIEQLVYDAAMEQYRSGEDDEFTVVAPTLFGGYEEGNKLKVFVTVYSQRYKLYKETLIETGGAIVPAAITYTKHEDGSYTVDEYREAMDGSYFSSSIREFSVMPISNKEIPKLAKRILDDYGNNKARSELLEDNLQEHLNTNGHTDTKLQSF